MSRKQSLTQQMPGWKVAAKSKKKSAGPKADAVSKSLNTMRKKYAPDADAVAAAPAADDADSVVMEKRGRRLTVEVDKKTGKIVTAQG